MESGLIKILITGWGILATVLIGLAGWLFRRVIAKHDEEMSSLNHSIICLGKKMDTRASQIEDRLDQCVSHETYETNRKETNATYGAIFEQIREIGNAVARIEGRMEKRT
jgi:hypothetical protein